MNDWRNQTFQQRTRVIYLRVILTGINWVLFNPVLSHLWDHSSEYRLFRRYTIRCYFRKVLTIHHITGVKLSFVVCLTLIKEKATLINKHKKAFSSRTFGSTSRDDSKKHYIPSNSIANCDSQIGPHLVSLNCTSLH